MLIVVIVTGLGLCLDIEPPIEQNVGGVPFSQVCPPLDSCITVSEAWSCASSKTSDTRKGSLTAVILGISSTHMTALFHWNSQQYFLDAEAKVLMLFPLHALNGIATFCPGS